MEAEAERQATARREASFSPEWEDSDAAENGPKEILVQCAGAPTVRVVDLPPDHRDRNECLVFNLLAQDISSRLVVFCDGRFDASSMGPEDHQEH